MTKNEFSLPRPCLKELRNNNISNDTLFASSFQTPMHNNDENEKFSISSGSIKNKLLLPKKNIKNDCEKLENSTNFLEKNNTYDDDENYEKNQNHQHIYINNNDDDDDECDEINHKNHVVFKENKKHSITEFNTTNFCDKETNSNHHPNYLGEKSAGSSGYYSSNLYSNSSIIDEHIYNEPIISNNNNNNNTMNLEQEMLKFQNQLYDCLKRSNRIDEIINKKLSKTDDDIQSFESIRKPILCSKNTTNINPYEREFPYYLHKYRPLITIMEGIDSSCADDILSSKNLTRICYSSEDPDDSLNDIDLSPFILNDNNKNTQSLTLQDKKELQQEIQKFHNNPEYLENIKIYDEHNDCNNEIVENQQKTTKKISKSSTNNVYKNFEERISLQNTKEMLEEIKIKLQKLSKNINECIESNTFRNNKLDGKTSMNELENNIKLFKIELDAYTRLLNYNNELEIKQFCFGLIKNHKLMTIMNAFERHKRLNDEQYKVEFNCDDRKYYANSNELKYPRLESFTLHQNNNNNNNNNNNYLISNNNSMRFSVIDSNFKLKRKPLCEIFPLTKNECYKDYSNDNNKIRKIVNDRRSNNNTNHSLIANNQSNSLSSMIDYEFQQKSAKKCINDVVGDNNNNNNNELDAILEWHKNKPSYWEMYYGTNRINQSLFEKRGHLLKISTSPLSYPSSRPESDFTLDLPRAEHLRQKLEHEKKCRRGCRAATIFLSLLIFVLTVMIVSLILTKGKRMFGSMI